MEISIHFSIVIKKKKKTKKSHGSFPDFLGESLRQRQRRFFPAENAAFLSFTSSAADVAAARDQTRADLSRCI